MKNEEKKEMSHTVEFALLTGEIIAQDVAILNEPLCKATFGFISVFILRK